jgi:hypothetical protein
VALRLFIFSNSFNLSRPTLTIIYILLNGCLLSVSKPKRSSEIWQLSSQALPSISSYPLLRGKVLSGLGLVPTQTRWRDVLSVCTGSQQSSDRHPSTSTAGLGCRLPWLLWVRNSSSKIVSPCVIFKLGRGMSWPGLGAGAETMILLNIYILELHLDILALKSKKLHPFSAVGSSAKSKQMVSGSRLISSYTFLNPLQTDLYAYVRIHTSMYAYILCCNSHRTVYAGTYQYVLVCTSSCQYILVCCGQC